MWGVMAEDMEFGGFGGSNGHVDGVETCDVSCC